MDTSANAVDTTPLQRAPRLEMIVTSTITPAANPHVLSTLSLALPAEQLCTIAEFVPSSDLLALRLSSKELSACSHAAFMTAFFATRKHHFTRRSMDQLLRISEHAAFCKAIERIELYRVEIEVQSPEREVNHTSLSRLVTPLISESQVSDETCQQLLVRVLRNLAESGTVPTIISSGYPLHQGLITVKSLSRRERHVLGEAYVRRSAQTLGFSGTRTNPRTNYDALLV